MDEKRLEQQIAFCREIDKEKFIWRQTWLTGATRKENDAEHAWHMAVMTVLLSEYANEEIDVLRTMTMLLIHDLVEIYAGDTYAYDEEGKKTQKAREEADAILREAKETADKRSNMVSERIQFRRIRERNSVKYGRSLRQKTRRNPVLPGPWTICSQ